jgi:hypothetical protein
MASFYELDRELDRHLEQQNGPFAERLSAFLPEDEGLSSPDEDIPPLENGFVGEKRKL